MESGYYLTFMTGIIGGFGHCIGMCGPIVASHALADSRSPRSFTARVLPLILYNSGRIITYTMIGAIMGLVGSFVNVAGSIAGIQNVVAIIAGIVMIAMGLSIAGAWGGAATVEHHGTVVLKLAKKVLGSPVRFRSFFLGLVLGLLPCGLSYTVFIAAAGTGSLFAGLVTGLLFGVGTLPALFLFGSAVSWLGSSFRKQVARIGGIIVIIMGIYFLYQGVRLIADL